jgi:hypothetical protein
VALILLLELALGFILKGKILFLLKFIKGAAGNRLEKFLVLIKGFL